MSRRKMLDDKEKSSYYSIVRGVSLSGRMTDVSEEIVDEMLAILSDRNRIMQKHATQEANDKWNLIMAQGLGENLDEE